MKFREATEKDISEILKVRNSVLENQLSDPNSVSHDLCLNYINNRGKGWVCEHNKEVVGFSIVDLVDRNVWALFVRPDFDKRGIGRKLHDLMVDWYFENCKENLWLGTGPGTRAESFYRNAGWQEVGKHGEDEIKFEMTIDTWSRRTQNNH